MMNDELGALHFDVVVFSLEEVLRGNSDFETEFEFESKLKKKLAVLNSFFEI